MKPSIQIHFVQIDMHDDYCCHSRKSSLPNEYDYCKPKRYAHVLVRLLHHKVDSQIWIIQQLLVKLILEMLPDN